MIGVKIRADELRAGDTILVPVLLGFGRRGRRDELEPVRVAQVDPCETSVRTESGLVVAVAGVSVLTSAGWSTTFVAAEGVMVLRPS